MPNRPSAGKPSLINPVEYWVAAPRVCDFACVARQRDVVKSGSAYSQVNDADNVGI